ncbi:sodium channel modifier 1 [Takifugu flavidus]|uniref:Sodium channel modifier 1 n=1 Tax=Takifugu flavidus TaxID=433684 RepID=A0A5C6PIW7_9TELE|nr:sodium channel modifier 1 [Takifugu flavidus]TWW79762.1 Sodium channel modifier 1 [Takifugu flavidus]
MSFKREGDDSSQLNILKKRRVEDLLSNFIPEDEAALMKNGRYTCLVCSYRPVFDTVDMLTVHRKGKRHLEGLKSFYGKKAKLKNEIAKRKHEHYVQNEDTAQEASSSAPLLTQTRKLTHHALLKTVPYNSCHRKTSTKCEKGSQNVLDVRTASKPAGSDDLGSLGDAADGCAADGTAPRPSDGVTSQEAAPLSAQRRRELEHYLHLKSRGWLQDGSGRWTKDEDVEFDSDEEEPPPLPPAAANESEA